jgi:YCII-related domain-containing protein
MTAAGFSKVRLGRMHDVMAGLVERGAAPGIVRLVSRRGEVHVDAIGMKAVGGSDPIRRDTIFRITGDRRCDSIAGFWMIQVKSKEEAIEWVKRCPNREAEIEIRQVFEASDFPAEISPPEDAAREQALREELQRKPATS